MGGGTCTQGVLVHMGSGIQGAPYIIVVRDLNSVILKKVRFRNHDYHFAPIDRQFREGIFFISAVEISLNL